MGAPAGLSRRTRLALLGAANVLGLGFVGWNLGLDEVAKTAWYHASPDRPAVVFVVIDTLRADRLAACGHDRPTSPVLEGLVADGAVLSCDAVAPGSWTVPSHASFFTGLPVAEHGAHFTGGTGEDIAGLVIHPLRPDVPTLAEQMTEQGYQAVGVSGNKVVRPESGLTRGFQSYRAAPWKSWWLGDDLLPPLRDALRELDDDDGPLFLFVNIFDAHDPWPAIPEGHPWLPPRPGTLLYFRHLPGTSTVDPDGPWQRYVQGRMAPDEARAFRVEVEDRYDSGVARADRTLGRVLDEVRAHGWLDAGVRLVVTSDHGEFLGEKGLLRHGRYLWEGNQRVPLLVHDSARTPPALPPAVSGLVVPSLVRDGALPDPLPVAQAAAFPDGLWLEQSAGEVGGSTSVAVWDAEDKLLWMDGEAASLDWRQEDEPGAPVPAGHPLAPTLEALVTEAEASAARGGEIDPELAELLRAAGYLE